MPNAHVVKGSGPPVLFIQGAGIPGKGWSPQVDGLSDRFTCAAFDNRGIDDKKIPAFTIDDMRRDALDVMDTLGWESAHVVGHSIGGLVAQSLALENRARVKSLTLMCTFHHGTEPSRMSPWIVWVGARTFVGTRSMRRRAFLEMILSAEERRRPDLDAFAEELSVYFGRDLADPAPVAMKQLAAAAKFDAASRLGELEGIPTLVLSATHDKIALPAFGRALAAAIPGAHYAERNAAHGLPITCANEVNDLLAHHFVSGAAPAA